jgi:hypothetical protein
VRYEARILSEDMSYRSVTTVSSSARVSITECYGWKSLQVVTPRQQGGLDEISSGGLCPASDDTIVVGKSESPNGRFESSHGKLLWLYGGSDC